MRKVVLTAAPTIMRASQYKGEGVRDGEIKKDAWTFGSTGHFLQMIRGAGQDAVSGLCGFGARSWQVSRRQNRYCDSSLQREGMWGCME